MIITAAADVMNLVDNKVEQMHDAQSALQIGLPGSVSRVAGLVDSAAALQVNIRTMIKREAARLADHELETVLVFYSKLLDAKLELVEVLSDH
jgi:hypothetical protein